MFQTHYDVVILGGGHNGLVAAAYLARAGRSVLLLERKGQLGGATISKPVFPGIDARLSQYAYLISLFPKRIAEELDLPFQTRRRRVASYTPTPDGRALLISNEDSTITAESFRRFTGSDDDYNAYLNVQRQLGQFASAVFPTLLEPLYSRDAHRARVDPALWDALIEQPLGFWLERAFKDAWVRGLMFTDAKIGTLTHPHDPSLLQNRCFLYHVIGNGTGEWQIIVGGMGALTQALEQRARECGARLLTAAEATRVTLDGEVTFHYNDQIYTVGAGHVLVNAAPAVLDRLLGQDAPQPAPEGCALKVNMLLRRLPRLRSGAAPEDAFGGTFHINESYTMLTDSYHAAAAGTLPDPLPCETYCHTLTDRSILNGLPEQYHTLTLFGMDVPARLFRADPAGMRAEALRRVLAGLNQYLAEPIEDCLATDMHGQPCIEARSALDIEADLAMPGGHIFHRDLTWFFAEDDAEVGQWGVETAHPRILLCGSGAKRGGGVSGIPGHNAAKKLLLTGG